MNVETQIEPASSFLIGAAVSGAPGTDVVPSLLTRMKTHRDVKAAPSWNPDGMIPLGQVLMHQHLITVQRIELFTSFSNKNPSGRCRRLSPILEPGLSMSPNMNGIAQETPPVSEGLD